MAAKQGVPLSTRLLAWWNSPTGPKVGGAGGWALRRPALLPPPWRRPGARRAPPAHRPCI